MEEEYYSMKLVLVLPQYLNSDWTTFQALTLKLQFIPQSKRLIIMATIQIKTIPDWNFVHYQSLTLRSAQKKNLKTSSLNPVICCYLPTCISGSHDWKIFLHIPRLPVLLYFTVCYQVLSQDFCHFFSPKCSLLSCLFVFSCYSQNLFINSFIF